MKRAARAALALLALGGCRGEPQEFAVLLAGDTGFGENYGSTRKMLEREGYDRAFRALRPLLAGVDEVVVNLETGIHDRPHSPFEGQLRWLHRADVVQAPRVLERHGLRALGLANNHALDYGVAGLRQTLEIAAQRGFATFGAGADLAAASRPYERRFDVGGRPGRLVVFAAFEYLAQFEARFAFYAQPERAGVRALADDLLQQIRQCRAGDPGALIVAFPHWGTNYRWRTPSQQLWGRRLIDAGADLVAGHGSHMLQEIERYRGGWIVYSLGNFVFNSPGRYERQAAPPYSLAARLAWSARGAAGLQASVRLYPIFSDNRISGYRPRPVTAAEFLAVTELLEQRSSETWKLGQALRAGRDRRGEFLEFELRPGG